MSKKIIIGRKKEQEILQETLNSSEAEMVAIIGRRRVGKTFLIKKTFEKQLIFEVTGLQNAPLSEQLENFVFKIREWSKSKVIATTPKSWLKAFMLLITCLEEHNFKEKKVVFLDELSWLATHKSGFLRALGFFWNSWAVNKNIIVVICGSAASWMINKVVNHRGGLHNRITKRIQLQPFTLAETKEYLQNKNINFKNYQIVQLYMAMGGVPHYLKEIRGNRSVPQNIDDICFANLGLLRTEFDNLYFSLFDNAENHIKIIRGLAKHSQGLTRKKIIAATNLPEGGSTTRLLNELIHSGFISVYYPFGKQKKNKLYRLTDEYSLFYLQFIENTKHDGGGTWQQFSQNQQYKIWSGYAYESICLKHIPQIKKALSIGGVYSLSSSFYKKGTATQKGTQIDLLIDRNDHVINLFEIKFYNKIFTISKEYAQKLKDKMDVFEEASKTRKQLFLTLITTFGLKHNEHSLGLINEALELKDLFEE